MVRQAPFEVEGIEGEKGDGEDDERENAENDARGNLFEREEEAGDAGEDSGQQEHAVPAAEEFSVEESEEDDESRSDRDEADNDVHDGVAS